MSPIENGDRFLIVQNHEINDNVGDDTNNDTNDDNEEGNDLNEGN